MPDESNQNPEKVEIQNDVQNPPKKKLSKNILLAIFAIPGIFCLALIAIYFSIKSFLTPENITNLIKKAVNNYVDQQVEIGKIQIDFPNAKIEDIRIGNSQKNPDLPFLAIKSLELSPDWFEAISGKISFTHFSLEEAVLQITKNSEGAIKIADNKYYSQSSNEAKQTNTNYYSLIPFKECNVNNFSVKIRDEVTKKENNIHLKSFSMKDSLLKTGKEIVFKTSLENYPGDIEFSGNLLRDSSINGEVSILNLDPKKISESIQQPLNFPISGEVSLIGKFSRDPFGKLNFENVKLLENGKIRLQGTADVNSFSPLELKSSIQISALEKDELEKLIAYIPNDKVKLLKLTRGKVSVNIEILIEKEKKPGWNVELKIEELSFKHPLIPAPIENLNANFSCNANILKIKKASFAFLSGDFELSNFFYSIPDEKLESETILKVQIDKFTKECGKFIPHDYLKYIPTGSISFNGKIFGQDLNFAATGLLESDKLNFLNFSLVPGIKINGLKIRTIDLSREKGKVVVENLILSIFGLPIYLKGEIINGKNPLFDLITSGKINLATLQEQESIEKTFQTQDAKFTGDINIEAVLKGPLSNLSPVATLTTTKVGIDSPKYNFKAEEINLSGLLSSNTFQIKKSDGKLAGGNFELTGKISNFTNPDIDCSAILAKIDLEIVRQTLLKIFPEFPKELAISGLSEMNVHISGKATKPEVKGKANLSQVSFFHPAIFRELKKISGEVAFDNRTITANHIKANWGSSTVDVIGKVTDLSKVVTDFSYTIKPLNLTDTGSFFLKDTGYSISGQGEGQGKITGPLEKIKVDGFASFTEGIFEAPISQQASKFKFPYKDLKANFDYTEGVLNISRSSAELFSGKVSSNGKIFLLEKPLKFEFKTTGTNLDVQNFLQKNTRLKNELTGLFNFGSDFSFSSQGVDSISGNISPQLKSGSYQSPPVLGELLGLLNAPNLSKGKFSESKGTFQVKDGKFNSDDFTIKTQFGELAFKGKLGFDTSIEGAVTLSIVNSECQSSGILKQLVGNSPSLQLPAKIHGNVFNPKIDLNIEKLLKSAAGKQLQEKFTEMLGGKPKNKQTSTSSSENENPDPLKNLGGQLMNGLEKKLTGKNADLEKNPNSATSSQNLDAQNDEDKNSPQKTIKKEFKKIESGIKNLFKF
ncbi:MAG: hypothetical protein HQM08_25365 [Candidatus Riflebacteria bacterium]|nr:hypothetical protein [Candidatus Riflebacteria bacterium]